MTITVEVRKGNLEKAMRVLKKKVQKEGIVRLLKQKHSSLKDLIKYNGLPFIPNSQRERDSRVSI